MQFTASLFATLSELHGSALMYANLKPPGDDYTVSGFNALEECRNATVRTYLRLALNFLIATDLFILSPGCEILLLAGKCVIYAKFAYEWKASSDLSQINTPTRKLPTKY